MFVIFKTEKTFNVFSAFFCFLSFSLISLLASCSLVQEKTAEILVPSVSNSPDYDVSLQYLHHANILDFNLLISASSLSGEKPGVQLISQPILSYENIWKIKFNVLNGINYFCKIPQNDKTFLSDFSEIVEAAELFARYKIKDGDIHKLKGEMLFVPSIFSHKQFALKLTRTDIFLVFAKKCGPELRRSDISRAIQTLAHEYYHALIGIRKYKISKVDEEYFAYKFGMCASIQKYSAHFYEDYNFEKSSKKFDAKKTNLKHSALGKKKFMDEIIELLATVDTNAADNSNFNSHKILINACSATLFPM